MSLSACMTQERYLDPLQGITFRVAVQSAAHLVMGSLPISIPFALLSLLPKLTSPLHPDPRYPLLLQRRHVRSVALSAWGEAELVFDIAATASTCHCVTVAKPACRIRSPLPTGRWLVVRQRSLFALLARHHACTPPSFPSSVAHDLANILQSIYVPCRPRFAR